MRKNINKLVSGIMIMSLVASSAMMSMGAGNQVHANTVENATTTNTTSEEESTKITAEGKLGDNVEYSYDEKSMTLTVKGSGEMWDDIRLPMGVFFVNNIIIEKGVTTIGSNIFSKYSGVRKIEIPDTVTTIKEGAFGFITDIELPASVKNVETNAFKSIRKLIVKGDLKGFACEAVMDGDIEEIELHGSGDDLGKILMNEYKQKSNCLITIADGNKKCTINGGCITSADKKEIYFCISDAKKVKIADTVEIIHSGAFANMKVEEITFGKNVKTIGDRAFEGSAVKKVKFNAGLKTIGDYAFKGTNLKSAKFSKKVTLGKGVFGKKVTVRNDAGIKKASTSIYNSKVKKNKLYVEFAKVADVTGYEVKVMAGKKSYKYTTKSSSFKKTLDKEIKEYYESVEYEYDYDDSVAVTVQVRPYKVVKGKKVFGKNSAKTVVEF